MTLSCEIRSKGVGEDIRGRRQTVRAAHRLGPEDSKNVGGGFSAQLILISSVCSVLLGSVTGYFVDSRRNFTLMRKASASCANSLSIWSGIDLCDSATFTATSW
jgi:hypothetical protein